MSSPDHRAIHSDLPSDRDDAQNAEQRADEALGAIERCTRAVLEGLGRAVAALGACPETRGEDKRPLVAHDLDLAVASWQPLVPADAGARAVLVRHLLERCGRSADGLPRLADALGFRDEALAAEFEHRYGESLEDALAAAPVRRPVRAASPLRREQLLALEHSFTRVELKAGEILFSQGDPGHSLYVIVTGRLAVLVGPPGCERRIHEVAAGEIVGELSVLTGEPRSATVAGLRDSELYRVDAEAVERHLLSEPTIVRSVMATLARRVATSGGERTPAPTIRNLALLPAGSTRAADVVSFANQLADAIASGAKVAVVERAQALATLGTDRLGDASSGLTRWLNDIEASHELVLYIADAGPSATNGTSCESANADLHDWAQRCVRQADLVVLVGAGDADPRPGAAELALAARNGAVGAPPIHLVLVHRPGKEPGQTSSWHVGRSVDRVHHVNTTQRAHLGRLARFLYGRPVGLVLSGGGLRGLCHIGAARALQDGGIPIDVVCATSAGAVIAAGLAMGWDAGELERLSRERVGKARRRLLDYTVPVTSLLAGTQLNELLDELFGDRQIEDLWLPLYCTVSDLTTPELVVLDSGSLRDALRASCALPVVFPPVVVDGHLLADGGVMNNLPVFPLIERVTLGTLVASNVAMPYYSADETYTYRDSLPWWKVLNARLNPLAPPLVAPSISKMLLRSLELGTKSLERAQAERADLYVRPNFAGMSDFRPTNLPQMVRAGYDAALEVIERFNLSTIPFR